MEIWNQKKQIVPISNTYKINSISCNKKEILTLKNNLTQTLDYLQESLPKLNNEAAYLSRMLFMNCKQYRMLRGFQESKKVNQALLRLLNLDICSVLGDLQGHFNTEIQDTLPYRQSLEYVLVKLLGASKLLVRIITCAKKSIQYFLGFVKAGCFFIKGAIILGTLSKIWNDSRVICENLCSYYEKLLRCKDFLRNGTEFIPTSFEFPGSLKTWLGDEWQEKVNDTKEYLEVTHELNEDLEDDSNIMEITTKYSKKPKNELEDFEPLSRDEVQAVLNTTPKTPETKHSLKKFKNIESYNIFIKNENQYRKDDQIKSLTISRFNEKQWKLLKDDLDRKSLLMKEKPFLAYVKNVLK